MNRNWKYLVLLAFTATAYAGCQSCGTSTTSTSRKPLGQRLFGSMGRPANEQPMPPYVPSSTLPGGLPPGAVGTPPPGAVIIGANGQPINPPQAGAAAFPPPGGNPPMGYPPIGAGSASGAPSVGQGTPFPPAGGYTNPALSAPMPPAVSTNPPPSATGPLNSQSRRFSNEDLQNSVRLGAPEVAESRKTEIPPTPYSSSAEPPLAGSASSTNPGTGSSGAAPSGTGPSNAGAVAPSATSTPSPLDIPRFIRMAKNLAVGRQPFPDGIVWLKDAGYRKVVHLAGPSEVDDAARKLFEREGIQYVRLELDPAKMDRAQVQQFASMIRPVGTEQIFVFDRDGTRLGAAWLAERILVDKAEAALARTEAENIGFAVDRLAVQDPVKQNLTRLFAPS